MNNLKKKKKGFTLVELMAVIAIIAILAAVLVPTVNGYINRSKKVAVLTQIRTVITAVDAYKATGSTIAKETVTISSLVEEDNGILANAELLYKKDINKLGDLIISQARLINEDPDAINKVILTNGILTGFGKDSNGKEIPLTPAS